MSRINIQATQQIEVSVNAEDALRQVEDLLRRKADIVKYGFLDLRDNTWKRDEGDHRGGYHDIRPATEEEVEIAKALITLYRAVKS